jgi:predicted amidophosphoribosyltransferase
MKKELSAPYKKTCKECGKIDYVPNEHEDCLECISKKQDFQSWETICLQCGKKTNNLKGDNKFCWDCLRTNSDKFREEFIAMLSEEERTAFMIFEAWREAWTSAIILD